MIPTTDLDGGSFLSYDNVLLVPRISSLKTRKQADTSCEFLGRPFKLPVIPANMESVINWEIAEFLSENGYFYIYHRFHDDTYDFVAKANIKKQNLISISVGVKAIDKALLLTFSEANLRVDYITIDVAHAHHILVKSMISYIRNLKWEKRPKIIAGNVATPQAVHDLRKWGADAVKVGIGQGSICTTRFETGFSVPMFSCVSNCSHSYLTEKGKILNNQMIPIIADGGIHHIGDIAKALVAGATMVMAGNLFASCSDSPAKINVQTGKKIYYGSTSFEAKKTRQNIEGVKIECNIDETYADKLSHIQQSLQSAISYAGGTNLQAFKNVEWITV